MKRSLLSCVALVAAFAAAGAAALAQPPERRQDAYGKLTKLTQTEIDLAILDDQGHSKTQIFTVARYARCGPAKIGAMVVVHFFTDAKGGNIAETLTVSVGEQVSPVPKPDEKQEPASVAETQPAVKRQLAGNSDNALAKTQNAEPRPDAKRAVEQASAEPSADRLPSASPVVAGTGPKKRVAILDFDYATVQTTSSAIFGTNVDVGKGIADLLMSGLVKDGSYTVVERNQLDKILSEQNFSNSNRTDPYSAAKIGKILGVDAIVVGSITEFGNDTKKTGLDGAEGNWHGFGLGNVGHSNSKANVDITARIIDVGTGEIMRVADATGQSSRSSTSMLGGGGNWHGFGAGNVDFGSSDFQQTIIGEATRVAVDRLSTNLSQEAPKAAARAVTIEGLVAAIDGRQIVLNVGGNAGVKIGNQFNVVRIAKEIKDPATGAVISRLSSTVGVVKATEVDDLSAVCEPVSGSGFKVGDTVMIVAQ